MPSFVPPPGRGDTAPDSPPRAGWRGSIAEVVRNILHLGPAAILLFITSVPSEALAYAEYIEDRHEALVFIRDPELADATVGEFIAMRASAVRQVNANEIYQGATVRVLAFAYSSDVAQTDANPLVTASGTTVQAGTIAANFLPFGTTVRLGEATYTVQDRLNARYNDKYIIDLWQPSHEAAIAWGARVVELEIVSLP